MIEQKNIDLELIRLTLSGDESAFGQIIDAYKARIFNLVYRMVNNYQESEDILQETFVKAYTRLSDFKVQNDFFPWLSTIALNITRNKLKRKKILKFFSLDWSSETDEDEDNRKWEFADTALTPEQEAIKKEETEQAQELIYNLPVKYKEVFLLRNMEEMSYEDIAKITRLPVGTVKTKLHRAVKMLEKGYKNYSVKSETK